MKLIVSKYESALQNSLLEKQLLDGTLLSVAPTDDCLLCYVNRAAVVVGHNQTIEAEVDVDYCRERGIEVVRRMSGGGTVWHDRGNLNWAFVLNRNERRTLDTDFLAPVVDALGEFGIEAEVGVRREILLSGKKISGTASHFGRERLLFHGTLLYDSDLEALHRALAGDENRRKKGVASVRSSVVNIKAATAMEDDSATFFERFIPVLYRCAALGFE